MAETRERVGTGAAAVPGGGSGGGSGISPGPFQHEFMLQFGVGVNQVTGQLTAPAGHGLVIETVTADVGVGAGEQANLFLDTTAGGVAATHTIALDELPLTPQVFQGTHPVRIYADAGSTVTVTLSRIGANLQAIAKPELVTLSGHTT